VAERKPLLAESGLFQVIDEGHHREANRMQTSKRQPFSGRLVMIGYGSIGRGVLPLLVRHIAINPPNICIICPSDAVDEASREGVHVEKQALTENNFHHCLEEKLNAGDFLLNLSIEVAASRYSRTLRALSW
jgi:homospermidine synthase